MTTHCDVGISPGVAHVLGVKPTINYLCGNYDGGGGIRDDLICIEMYGTVAAAVDCPACLKVAEMLHRGKSLNAARKAAKRVAMEAGK